MHDQFVSVPLREDVPSLGCAAQVKEGCPGHMLYGGAK